MVCDDYATWHDVVLYPILFYLNIYCTILYYDTVTEQQISTYSVTLHTTC